MIGLLLEKARLFYRDVGYSTDEVGYYGFTNQFGHMMLGYFLVWAVGHYTGLGFWASLVIVAAVYTAWEAVQDMPSNYRALGDIATDWAFVVGGGLMLLLPGLCDDAKRTRDKRCRKYSPQPRQKQH